MIRHIILAAGLLALPMQARADWLDDIAVKYGCAPRPSDSSPTLWYCDGTHGSPTPKASAEFIRRYGDPSEPPANGVQAVMKRLRREGQ